MDALMISNFTNSKTKTYSFNEPEILTNFNHTLKVIPYKINKLKKKKLINKNGHVRINLLLHAKYAGMSIYWLARNACTLTGC